MMDWMDWCLQLHPPRTLEPLAGMQQGGTGVYHCVNGLCGGNAVTYRKLFYLLTYRTYRPTRTKVYHLSLRWRYLVILMILTMRRTT